MSDRLRYLASPDPLFFLGDSRAVVLEGHVFQDVRDGTYVRTRSEARVNLRSSAFFSDGTFSREVTNAMFSLRLLRASMMHLD